MRLESVSLITFDCYGTLIDWENGMLAVLRPLLSRNGSKVSDLQILELYGEIEAELESGPYLPYRQILAKTAQEIGGRLGVKVSAEEGRALAASLMSWKPFADTVPALQSLAKRFRLGIISNVDDDLFAETRKKLSPVGFDFAVTAQQMRSYKPAQRNFEEAMRRSGLGKDQILHAGQSLYHDIAPQCVRHSQCLGKPAFNQTRIGSSAARNGNAGLSSQHAG